RILHLRFAALAREAPGRRDGIVETAQLVDELQLLCALAGVDAALGDLADARLRQAAALRDRLHELGVDIVGDALDLFAIGLVDGPEGRERVIVLAALQGGLLHLASLHNAANIEIHEAHADAPHTHSV